MRIRNKVTQKMSTTVMCTQTELYTGRSCAHAVKLHEFLSRYEECPCRFDERSVLRMKYRRS